MPEERKITCDECGYSKIVPSSRLSYEEGKTCPKCYKGKMYWVPPAEEARRRKFKKMLEEEKGISPVVAIIPIGLGLGLAAVVGLYALARAALGVITIYLKNPPAEGDYWQIMITNASQTDCRFTPDIPLDEAATFDIPADWDFPLPIDIIVYQWGDPEHTFARQVYRVQSWAPGYADYKAMFIEAYGSYYFNVATEMFEGI